jgi:hypothetical protein
MPGAWVTHFVQAKVPYYGTIKFLCNQKKSIDGSVTVCHTPKDLRMIFRIHIKMDDAGRRVLEERCKTTGIKLQVGVVFQNGDKRVRNYSPESLEF